MWVARSIIIVIDLHCLDLIEHCVRLHHCLVVTQGGEQHALAERLDQDRALTAVKNDAREAHFFFATPRE
jgi:hypothetical protein